MEWIAPKVQEVRDADRTSAKSANLLVAVVAGDVQRGEEHGILDTHEGSVLQEYVCCLA